MNIKEFMSTPVEMGTPILTHTFKRLRLDNVVESVIAEIDAPTEHTLPTLSEPFWVCQVRVSGLLPAVRVIGQSSLGAVTSAVNVIGNLLTSLPFSNEFLESIQPNFGLPCCALTTTTEAFAEKQVAAQSSREQFLQRATAAKTAQEPSL